MADFEAAIERLPKFTVTWFSRGAYDRMLINPSGDKGRVIGLPLVNGAR